MTATEDRLALTLPAGVTPCSAVAQSPLIGATPVQRPPRPADAAAEVAALVALATALGEAPDTVCQLLADNVLALLKAGSAGVSVLSVRGDGAALVNWPAIAGRWRAHTGSSRLLLEPGDPAREATTPQPTAAHALIVPFGAAGKMAGTVWAVAHDAAPSFGAEDLRQLQDLALFAAPALQAMAARDAAPALTTAAPALGLHGSAESQHATFTRLIENAPFGVYVVDAQFRLCQASAAARKAFASVRPLIGRDFGEVVRAVWPEPFASEVLAHFRRTLDSGVAHAEPTLAELRRDTPEIESYDWKIERVVLPDGDFGVVCTFYDLTERQQAAEALRLRTAQFETLFNGAPLGIYLVDADLRICQINPQALPEFGNIPGLIGQELAAVMQAVWGPARADDIVQQFRHTLNTGEPFEAEELIAVRVDRGTTACYEWQIHRIPLPDGSHGVICHFREISKRVQAQAQVRDSEMRFRAFVTASSDVVYRMSADWREMCQLDGRNFLADAPEPTTGWLQDYIQPQDQAHVLAAIDAAIANKSVFELEHRVLRVGGDLGWTRSRAVPLLDADGAIVEWFGTASDVTDTRRAQQTLLESEERYRSLFNAMDEGYCIFEMIFDEIGTAIDYRFLEVNPAFAKLTGVADAVGRRMREIAPDLEEEWFITFGTVARTGESVRFVSDANPLDQRCFDVFALKVGGPDSHKVAALFTNITERRRIEAALRASEEQFRATFENAAIGIEHIGLDHRWLRVNPAMCNLTGYTAEELVTMAFTEVTHPDDLADDLLQVQRLLAGETASYKIEKRLIHRSGRDVWVTATTALLRDAQGRPQYLIGALEDITQQKATLAQLELQRRFVERLAHGMPNTLHVFGQAERRNLWVNRHLGDTLGYSAEDIVRMGADFLPEVLHPEDVAAMELHLDRVFESADDAVQEIEFRVRDRAGHWRWLRQSDTVFRRGPDGLALELVGTATDVTGRKAIEVALIAALAAAEDANRAKSDFLSRMSHELRSPLNAVLGFAQLLQSGTPPPTARQEECVGEILKAGWYLLGLIEEILDLSLIESGHLSCVLEPVPLAEVLSDCQALVEGQAAARGIRLSLAQLDDGCIVIADRTRLKQVFINLLSNAIKYNREGGTVQVQCEAAGQGRLCIRIEDSGSGLSPEQLDHIFQPFERLGQEAGAIEGTGIGLALSKRLVELMGGRIGVHSVVGQGSVFWVELDAAGAQTSVPASSPETAPARLRVAAAPLPAAAGRRPCTVLYVEDNRANQLLVQRLLARRSDVRLLLAGDAQHGVELARAMQPDVVLMDINLPDMNGLEAMARLAADPATARIPVIAVSALAMRHDIDKGLQAGFFRYLSKPIKIDALTEALDAALDLADRPEEAPARAVVAQPALTASSATSPKNSNKVHTP
jgi:PAS domain S-box-containing protein